MGSLDELKLCRCDTCLSMRFGYNRNRGLIWIHWGETMNLLKRWGVIGSIVAGLLIAGTAAARPLAHERVVSGDYALTMGWLEEPPVVGLKNAVLVQVAAAKDDQPVEGAEGSLTAQIVYGGKSKELLLRPLEEKPGSYVGDLIPTRRGTYTLKLGGTINGQPVGVSTEIEEVSTPDSLAFPEPQADLQASIEALQSELSTTRMFAIVGAALGTIGLVLAGVVLGRSRQ